MNAATGIRSTRGGVVAALSALIAAVGCGSDSQQSDVTSSGAGPGGGGPSSSGAGAASVGAGGSGPYPAPHPAMPQEHNYGGPIMTAPKVVAITFSDDSLGSAIDTFMGELAAAPYWSAATAEYGVGPLTALPPVHRSETTPYWTYTGDVDAWIENQLIGSAGVPQPDANTIYAIFYASTMDGSLGASGACTAFHGAYRNSLQTPAGTDVAYVVVTRCPPPEPDMTPLDGITIAASRALVGAATEPFTNNPAWADVDPDHQGWRAAWTGFRERFGIGDLCALNPDTVYKPQGIDDFVQRVWSNQAAAAGHDPCVPNQASPYFNSVPVLSDTIDGTDMFGTYVTKGVYVPAGSTKTIELDLYSDGPTSGPWTLSTVGGMGLQLAFPGPYQGQNGDKLELAISALGNAPSGSYPFLIFSELGGVKTLSVGIVQN